MSAPDMSSLIEKKRARVAVAGDPARALVKAIAMDIGKQLVAYIEVQYPEARSLAIRSLMENLGPNFSWPEIYRRGTRCVSVGVSYPFSPNKPSAGARRKP